MHGLRATSTYSTLNSPELGTSMVATTRILVSKLTTARVFCLPQRPDTCLPSLPAVISPFLPSRRTLFLLGVVLFGPSHLAYSGFCHLTPHIGPTNSGLEDVALENLQNAWKRCTHRSARPGSAPCSERS